MKHPKAKFDTWSFDEPVKSLSSWNPLSASDLCLGGRYKTDADSADLVFLCCHYETTECETKEPFTGEVKAIDDTLGGALETILREESQGSSGFSKAGSMTPTLRILGVKGFVKYVVVSLGKPPSDDTDTGKALGKALAVRCIEEGSPSVQTARVLVPAATWSPSVLRELSASFYCALYADHRFRGSLTSIKAPKIPAEHLRRVTVQCYLGKDSDDETTIASLDASVAAALEEGKQVAKGVHLARDIVNAPHNVLNSLSLADLARTIASESGGCLTCQILDKDDCEKLGMGAYLGVARASETPPQFIHLTYTPPQGGNDTDSTTTTTKPNKVVGVVGKGLLFDTGGYNIKTAMMELMKFDCGGAAAVLGAAKIVAAIQPRGVECHFCVAACENMVNDKGIVPSDVLVAANGVTIEVLNTDAEGRLTLADALVYCDQQLGCEKIIELSTLTGACMVALGKEVCGVFTEHDGLAEELKEISKVTGEASWRMPLVKSYEKQLESKIADINNYGTRFGGCITAGLFLQHFVDTQRVPFAHIDIAGPVWDDSTGATGFGARLVTEWICRQGQ